MLSRHYLRAKALQTIYGWYVSQGQDPHAAVNAFERRVNRLNVLAIYQLSLLPEFVRTAERVNEEVKQKFNPSFQELNPSPRFVNNQLIAKLDENYDFRKICDKLHVDWALYSADLHQFYTQVRDAEEYKSLISGESTFAGDKRLALSLFCDLINDSVLRQRIIDRDSTWEDDYDQIAQYNYLMLKEMDEEWNAATHFPLMNDDFSEKDLEAFDFAKLLVRKTLTDISSNADLIEKYLARWDLNRVAVMDLIIINMAITELVACPSIPISVTMNEYVELTREYSADKSKLFVNGILDRICTELKREGLINKVGRGMECLFDENENES